jgi:broad specificity phosphatase PhoE
METTLYIVRHGQSEGNVNGDITGLNPPLTQKGVEQAKVLAQLIEPISIDQIISSNLMRAKQTADIIATHKGLTVIEAPQIKERFFGELEGVRGDEISVKYKNKWDQFHQISLIEQMDWRLVESMESLREVLERTLLFIDSITETQQPRTSLLVTHANVMLALLAHFSFVKSFNELPYGSIQNTAYIKLNKREKAFQIEDVFGITKKV